MQAEIHPHFKRRFGFCITRNGENNIFSDLLANKFSVKYATKILQSGFKSAIITLKLYDITALYL